MLLTTPAFAKKLDLIQIDTGNKITRKSKLHMPKTKTVHVHGNDMATVLENELNNIDPHFPVQARQELFKYPMGDMDDWYQTLENAIEDAPKVISMSLSGEIPYKIEKYMMQQGVKVHDILFLVAAGNRGPKSTVYPSQYKIDCLLSVGTKKKSKKIKNSGTGDIYMEEIDPLDI